MTAQREKFSLKQGPGPSYTEILHRDSRTVPDHLMQESPGYFGDDDIPVARYTSREFHEQEKEKVWSRVWQMACREEHLAEVGDTYVYDICDRSVVLVRSAPDEIRAFWNSCLHRGRQLCTFPERVETIKCPFHGFAWKLDGSLAYLPARWDFPQVEYSNFRLPQLKVGIWQGFVFVNPDLDADPLEDFLGDIDMHFGEWNLRDRYVEAHVAKVYDANWKVVQEAFMEAFHVALTHPQQLTRLGDTNSRYDCYDNYSRSMHASGTPSPALKWQPSEQEMLDSMLDVRLDEDPQVLMPDGRTLRDFGGDLGRESLRPAIGDRADKLTDAELVDAIDYTIFPNLHPWAAFQRVVYRFRPNGDQHESSIMEVFLLSPFSGERPPPSEMQLISTGGSWTEASSLGVTARILDQDSSNIAAVQKGLRTTAAKGLPMALYQESKIRHWHWLLERWLDAERTTDVPD
jgi:phenylpropionate dioxygenase-like ring-hydroxylating dioxygenase large terminal subunit